jgi:lipopolysaccharide/colanic/teichoic acid biosynthesis glycosyltransferase
MSTSTEITPTSHRLPATKPVWQGWQFAVKHSMDRGVALVALLVLVPLLLVIALAVRLSSPGRILFRQRRVGRDGQTFELLKFRSMREDRGPTEFELAEGVAPGGVEGIDRRTRVGRWLRASSLDELPQLLNVLRGDMSLIGPRPERPEFAERFATEIPGYADRHRVKSGITGWAQANGLRGQTPISDRVKYDNYYIDHWSIQLEFMTIVLTAVEVLRFREARTSRPRPAQLPA